MLDRTEIENALARRLARLSQRQLGRLMDALGEPPRLENLTLDVWDEFAAELRAELQPTLEQIFLERAQDMLAELPEIGVDWGLINEQASAWAQQYSFDLVKGVNATTQEVLQKEVANFFAESMTMPQLREALTGVFGPVRAEMIAVTETTRAAVEGQAALVEELNQSGIVMRPHWTTAEDEKVCPICGGLSGVQANADGTYTHPKTGERHKRPPAHPRCRCDEAYEFQGD